MKTSSSRTPSTLGRTSPSGNRSTSPTPGPAPNADEIFAPSARLAVPHTIRWFTADQLRYPRRSTWLHPDCCVRLPRGGPLLGERRAHRWAGSSRASISPRDSWFPRHSEHPQSSHCGPVGPPYPESKVPHGGSDSRVAAHAGSIERLTEPGLTDQRHETAK